MITKCPETEMLLEYSAGSMQLAPSIAVTAHLNFCDACASTSKSLQDIGGHLLDQHCEEISDEWRNCTPELMRLNDPKMVALITKKRYRMPLRPIDVQP